MTFPRPARKGWLPRLTIVASTVLLVGFLTAPPSLAAPLCQLDSAAHILTVTNQGSGVDIRNSGGGNLLVNHTACAVISSIDLVNIDMAYLGAA